MVTTMKSTLEKAPLDIRLELIYVGFAEKCVKESANKRKENGMCTLYERASSISVPFNCPYINGVMCSYPNKQD